MYVSKDRIIEVVGEAVSIGNANLMRGLKKNDLVRQANSELTGLRWLPETFKAG